MPLLTIRQFPDPVLRQKAKDLDPLDPSLPGLVRDLFATMYHAEGVGLAANQVGLAVRVAVIDCSGGKDPAAKVVLINPVILETAGNVEEDEGCLSFAGMRGQARRGERCRVRAFGLDGHAFEIESGGLLGKALQHEIDHLNGRLFIDHLSLGSRAAMEGKLKQMKRDYQAEHRSAARA
jgi:peptide deformylase